uniref:alpha/beta fold hydrolase n=1 Tax=Methylobacterium sp. B34 TaxID=95563 RepID=UPI000A00E570|nr:alpha/beta hydrolase [Methylobacterium sp. B34]
MSEIYKNEVIAKTIMSRYRELLELWPVDNDKLIISTRKGETFVVACGDRHAQPLILLHGMQANSAIWMQDVVKLAQHFRVYAVDILGEPGLSAPTSPPFSSDGYEIWLDDVLASLGVEQTAILGVSLGGWIGLNYAIRRPNLVKQLAVVCPAGIGRQKNFLLRAAPLMLLGPWGIRQMRELVIGPERKDLLPRAQKIVDLMKLIGRHARFRALRPPIFSDTALRSLDMPVLAIVGGRDVLIDSHETKRRLEILTPRAEVRLLPDALHYIPDQIDEVINFFIAQKQAGSATLDVFR